MTLNSSYELLRYLIDSQKSVEVSFEDQGGMGHLMGLKEFPCLSNESNIRFKDSIREYFDEWFSDSNHPDFYLPPSSIEIKFFLKDNVITASIETVYRWDLNELSFDEDYIIEYGGVIDEDEQVTVESSWGEVNISVETPPFNDTFYYEILS
jgi:hypothetical protein